MSVASKMLERMRANPRNDWTMDDVRKVAKGHGCGVRKPKRGSHYTISHESQVDIVTVPKAKPIKAVYIVSLVTFIDSVIGA